MFNPMCGRVRLSSDVSEIKLVFGIPPERTTPNFPSTWNGAPTDQLPIVRFDGSTPRPASAALIWRVGALVPYWAKDIEVGFANINAKAEGIETRPAFREAFQRRRCLVPTGKQPYAIALADRGIMALAGLWENWRSPAGEWIRSFGRHLPAERAVRQLHDRMPVLLSPEAWRIWLSRARR
jgi:putative SOS response-associated peptidase YedK